MTCIAYRDGMMAADSVGWACDGHVKVPVPLKIVLAPDGGLLACCGGSTDIGLALGYLLNGGEKPTLDPADRFGCIWAKPDGSLWYVTSRLIPTREIMPFAAIGASDRFMMGALFAGATAEQAVRLAVEHTDGGGGDVQVERVEYAPSRPCGKA